MLLLCEYVIETQLGEHVLSPVGRVLIRGGALSLSNIAEKTGASPEHITNCIAVLLKHNLLRADFNSFKHAYFYTFNLSECLLRLSVPRYLTETLNTTPPAQGGPKADSRGSLKSLVRFAIMREIFLAGSLLKSELAQLLAR